MSGETAQGEGLSLMMLTLKTEEGAHSQGKQVASRSLKRQGNRSLHTASRRECCLTETQILVPGKPVMEFQSTEI